jgi:diguanylate cyclase (GGDEF)-like protein
LTADSKKRSHRADAIWIASLISLVFVFVTAIAITWWSTSKPDASPAESNHAHHEMGHGADTLSHNDFFTNGGLYMPRTHCLMNEAGNPDWPWIIALITLSLIIIAAYVRIYLFWCKSYFSEEPQDRNPRLMDLAQMFLWCAVTGYAASVLVFFWPAYRLVAVCMLFLAFWAWRFCLNISDFRTAFTAGRYRRLVNQDPLTGLLNRAAVYKKLNHCLTPTDDQAAEVTVLFLDFDRFKLVNDSMGHEAGDELLKQIAKRLTKAVQFQAFDEGINYHIARIGGDEFVIVVEGCSDRDRIEALTARLHNDLTCVYTIDSRKVNSSASIGIASTERTYTSADTMLRDADLAMYEAKNAGRACTAWFDKAMHDAANEAVELENDLQRAIERDELFLTYQPLLDLEEGRVTGFESLIRWRHPERGLIRPDQFIPLAEDSLLIRPIGRWVIREALQQVKAWRQQFPELADCVMNVNLSRIQFADVELTEYILDTLNELGLPNSALCLEITESTIMQDSSNAMKLLQRFRELGIKLAMDDFGTGYSSLSHLHEFPLDAIKIDRAFIANLSNNRDYAAVVHAITALADNLGFTVVAEGIETREQLAQLQALSCHKGQGYLIHKPAEASVIAAWLSDRQEKAQSA